MVIFICYNSSKRNLKYFPLTVINREMVDENHSYFLIMVSVGELRYPPVR